MRARHGGILSLPPDNKSVGARRLRRFMVGKPLGQPFRLCPADAEAT